MSPFVQPTSRHMCRIDRHYATSEYNTEYLPCPRNGFLLSTFLIHSSGHLRMSFRSLDVGVQWFAHPVYSRSRKLFLRRTISLILRSNNSVNSELRRNTLSTSFGVNSNIRRESNLYSA